MLEFIEYNIREGILISAEEYKKYELQGQEGTILYLPF